MPHSPLELSQSIHKQRLVVKEILRSGDPGRGGAGGGDVDTETQSLTGLLSSTQLVRV